MSPHTEDFHRKRLIKDHLDPLLNEYHANDGYFYRDRRLRKYVVHAGPRTKSRLEFLLENDADLNPYEFGSHLAAAVPGSEDLHLHCGWLRGSS